MIYVFLYQNLNTEKTIYLKVEVEDLCISILEFKSPSVYAAKVAVFYLCISILEFKLRFNIFFKAFL